MNWLEIAEVAPTAAVISALVTIVIRWFDRPRAVLRTEVRLTQVPVGSDQRTFSAEGATLSARVALMNVGDGDAYDVKAFGSKCDPAIQVESHNWVYSLPVIRAGDTELVVVAASDDPSKIEGAAVMITWSPRPK